ncbi:MAG TPA: 3-deoxy-7-phosphoheptulonate synthase [Anaerolineaceae bacterium]
MMIIMNVDATETQVETVVERIKLNGFKPIVLHGEERKVIAVVGNDPYQTREKYIFLAGVDRVMPISRPYKITSREFKSANTVFPLDGLQVGGNEVVIMAGPCSVESRSQLLETAQAIKEAGAQVLRGGAYKPRTSPYSFQGLGEEGLELLAEARELTGLPVITEVTSHDLVPLVAKYADVLQIGARNMQNFALLNAAGESQHPVLLKRGNSATIEELLMSAEYILSHGNQQVILCERGIRTFETSTRNTTDINSIPVLKSLTHLPVFLDPSHSTGHWEYVTPIARAGIAAGADGLIIEVHSNPEMALSDGAQSLKPERFAQLVRQVRAIALDVERC